MVMRSTGQSNRTKAKQIAGEMEKVAKEAATLSDSTQDRIINVVCRAKEKASQKKITARIARSYIREIFQIATGNDLPSYTIREWVEEWMSRQEGLSRASLAAYTTNTSNFLSWVGDRHDEALETISTDDMRAFRAWLSNGAGKNRKASNKTVANKIKTVTSLFASAVLEGLIDSNPAQALKKLDEDEVMQRQPFMLTEVDTLIKAAPNRDWRGLITIGAFTGLRLGDCLNLKWNNIHIKNAYIEVTPQKTKSKNRKVKIPIVPVMMAFLMETPPDERKGDILPELAQRKVSGRTSVSVDFIEIMAKAGVGRGNSINNGCITKYEKSFHSLRHTFTTMLSNASVPEEVRMELLGHSTREVHAGYTHFDLKTLALAMSGIPQLPTTENR